MNKFFTHIVLFFLSVTAYSQGTVLFDTSTSTINSDKIIVDRAPRIYSQAKSDLNLSDTLTKPVSFNFNYNPSVNLSPLKTKVAIYRLKIKQEDNSKSGLIRAGIGNYGSTLLDAYYGSRANSNWAYGLGYNHLASLNGNINKNESGFSENSLKAHTKYFTNKSVLNADIFYDRKLVRNYGYVGAVKAYENLSSTPTVDSAFTYDESLVIPSHKVGGNISLETELGENFTSEVIISPSYLKVNDSLNTFNFEGKVLPVYKLNFGDINIPISWNWNNHTTANGEVKRNLIDFSPTLSHLSDDERLQLEGGIKTNITNDTTLSKKVSIYPLIKASYLLSSDLGLTLKGELSGGINQYNLMNIYDENPFIKQVQVASSNNKITLNTALDYAPLANLKLKAFLNYSLVENFSFFSADTLDLSFYRTEYALDPTTVITPGFTASYKTKKGHSIDFGTRFNSFSNESDQEIYFTPKSTTELGLSYKVNQKIKISSDISYISGLVGYNPIENTDYELDNILDLNLKLDYKINNKLGAFLYGNNLLNKNYEFYRFYSVNGITVLGGLTYNF